MHLIRCFLAAILPIACSALALLATACKTGGSSDAGLKEAFSGGNSGGRPITELNSSVIAVGDGDWLNDRCVAMVDRAAQYPQSKIMFVPTLFWVQNGDGPIDHYCYARENGACAAATADTIARFKAAIQRCFQRAVDHNLSIAVTPHLDDGTGQGRWRNVLDFDPWDQKNGFSYADVALFPIADALNAVAKTNTKVYLGMQGEMSVTVFKHPKSWQGLADQLRIHLAQGKDPSYKSNVQIGVSTNFNKLSGVGIGIIDPSEYVKQYPQLWETVKNQFDLNAIKALFDNLDYLGMSSYPSLYPGFPTREVENAISQFDFEFSFFGITVADLIAKGKKIHFSEYGVGGGISQNGDRKAYDAAGAASLPFFGIFKPYTKAMDPWVLYDLNQPSEVRDYQRYFYAKTLDYLNNSRRYKYQIDAAFLWNQSSWDVQAIYPESTSNEGSYRDPVIVEMINQHNQMAMAGQTVVAVCTDEAPPNTSYSCSQQAGWGKCSEGFMAGYCEKTCGKCQ